MNSQQAYNAWTANYDAGINKTRDIEAVALKETLSQVDLSYCQVLEIGCGTGKNTVWLLSKASKITAIDFSEEMLSRAKSKIPGWPFYISS